MDETFIVVKLMHILRVHKEVRCNIQVCGIDPDENDDK